MILIFTEDILKKLFLYESISVFWSRYGGLLPLSRSILTTFKWTRSMHTRRALFAVANIWVSFLLHISSRNFTSWKFPKTPPLKATFFSSHFNRKAKRPSLKLNPVSASRYFFDSSPRTVWPGLSLLWMPGAMMPWRWVQQSETPLSAHGGYPLKPDFGFRAQQVSQTPCQNITLEH